MIFAIEMRNSLQPVHVEAESFDSVLAECNIAAAAGKSFIVASSPGSRYDVMINVPNINVVRPLTEDSDAFFTG